jgi:hypothetical protein
VQIATVPTVAPFVEPVMIAIFIDSLFRHWTPPAMIRGVKHISPLVVRLIRRFISMDWVQTVRLDWTLRPSSVHYKKPVGFWHFTFVSCFMTHQWHKS